MCELLGLCFDKPVVPDPSLCELAANSSHHCHGWGIAWYPDKTVQILKEPVEMTNSQIYSLLKCLCTATPRVNVVMSKIILAHIRRASDLRQAPMSHHNCHPFHRRYRDHDFVFAHNGTIRSAPQSSSFKPLGETDSELAFCWLMDYISGLGVGSLSDIVWKEMHDKLIKLNDVNTGGKDNKLNCLISDGTHLVAYSDKNADRDFDKDQSKRLRTGLFILERTREAKLAERGEDAAGFVVATRPLTPNEPWQWLDKETMIVFKDGVKVYDSRV